MVGRNGSRPGGSTRSVTAAHARHRGASRRHVQADARPGRGLAWSAGFTTSKYPWSCGRSRDRADTGSAPSPKARLHRGGRGRWQPDSPVMLQRTLEALQRRLGVAAAPFMRRQPSDQGNADPLLQHDVGPGRSRPTGCRSRTAAGSPPTGASTMMRAAVVFHIPSLREPPHSEAAGQLWVAWSLECDANYPQLRDPAYMRQFDLTMTYRLDADVHRRLHVLLHRRCEPHRGDAKPPKPKSRPRIWSRSSSPAA